VFFLIGIFPCVYTWRRTRASFYGTAAMIRAAAVALFLVPTWLHIPDREGALILTAWPVIFLGPLEIGIGDTIAVLLIPPGAVFLVVYSWLRFWYRRAHLKSITSRP